MAPELAFESLKDLPKGSTILDPMTGSGMVARQANELGLSAIGFDMDPLAVLMTRAWTQPVHNDTIETIYNKATRIAISSSPSQIKLPWIDTDKETTDFIKYWFGDQQEKDLRRWAHAINVLKDEIKSDSEKAAFDILCISFSRIIVTKEQCASLARDTSHSRPHKVATRSNYCIFQGLERSLRTVQKRLAAAPPKGGTTVKLGDARSMDIPDRCIDGVLTSPPYLNAIDYMLGHKMSLVWLGHNLSELRLIRFNSIGAERAPENKILSQSVREAFGELHYLPRRYTAMIDRYANDIIAMTKEIKAIRKSGLELCQSSPASIMRMSVEISAP